MRLAPPQGPIYNPDVSSLLSEQAANPAPHSAQQLAGRWVQTLAGLGLANLAASLLEANAGFGILAAQTLHISRPVAGAFVDESALSQAADALEDPRRLQTLIDQLREAA